MCEVKWCTGAIPVLLLQIAFFGLGMGLKLLYAYLQNNFFDLNVIYIAVNSTRRYFSDIVWKALSLRPLLEDFSMNLLNYRFNSGDKNIWFCRFCTCSYHFSFVVSLGLAIGLFMCCMRYLLCEWNIPNITIHFYLTVRQRYKDGWVLFPSIGYW